MDELVDRRPDRRIAWPDLVAARGFPCESPSLVTSACLWPRASASTLDIIATVEPRTDQHTGLYPVTSKLVRDEWERLRREKITPWAFFNSGKPMNVVDFYGKQILCSGSGVTFEGSARMIFWGRYIEPFLEDIVLRILDRTAALCKEEGHAAKPALMETGLLLKRLIRDTYEAMADIDQRLRGRGYPDTAIRRNVSGEVDAMGRFTDDRMRGLIAVARPSRTRFQRWKDYVADHPLGAAVLLIVTVLAGAAAFTENVSKLAVRAKTWFNPAPGPVVVHTETSVQFQRPELLIETPLRPNTTLDVRQVVINHGQETARSLLWGFDIAFTEMPPSKGAEEAVWRAFIAKTELANFRDTGTDLGKGEFRWMTLGQPRRLSAADVADLQNGRAYLYVTGIASYRDRHHELQSELCVYLEPPGHSAVWRRCNGHNVVGKASDIKRARD